MKMLRGIWMAAGLLFVGLGIIGAFLPIMPTVPFLLLAVFCFTRSRPEWAECLHNHPTYGASLREWRDNRAIPRKAKISAILAMAVGAVFSALTLPTPWPYISLGVLVICGTWIWTRNE